MHVFRYPSRLPPQSPPWIPTAAAQIPEEPRRSSILVIGEDVTKAVTFAGLFFVIAAPKVAEAAPEPARQAPITVVDSRAIEPPKDDRGLQLIVTPARAPVAVVEERRAVPITIISERLPDKQEALFTFVKAPSGPPAAVTDAIVTQLVAEIVVAGGNVKQTQLAVEAIVATANAVVTQLALEVIVETAVTFGILVTQFYLEIIVAVTAELEHIEEVFCTGFPTHTIEVCPENTVITSEVLKAPVTHAVEPCAPNNTTFTEEAKPSPFSGSIESEC